MPTFLRRLKQSIRLRSRQTSHTRTTINSPMQQDGHNERSADYYGHDEDHRDRSSPSSPLPEIRDSGPPTANRYSDADIFWNSTMTEVDDSEKRWIAKRTRKNNFNTNNVDLLIDAGAGSSKYTSAANFPTNTQEESGTNAASELAAAWQRANGDVERLKHNISSGKERADNDLIVMFCATPIYEELPTVHPRQHISLNSQTVGTRELDDPADASLQNITQVHCAEPEQTSATLQGNTSVLRSSNAPREERDLPDVLTVHHNVNLSSGQSSRMSTVLTWNMCLSEIMSHSAVDPAIKEAIRNRVKHSKTSNGSGEDNHFFVSAAEAGLVPNFSYPVTGSPFFDHFAIKESPLPSLVARAVGDNCVEQERHVPDLIDRSLGFDFGFDLSNGVPSSSSPLSSYSCSNTSDSLYRAPSPVNNDTLNNRIDSLLSEVLTTSELNLCHTILNTPPDSAATHSDTQTHLTRALHTLIHHLQDRILHLEDTLLPHLGTTLAHKTFNIDVLSNEIQNLGDQIRELKLAVDFGNSILVGCWVREYEVWRTLVEIKENRRKGWCRWLMKKKEVRELTGRELDALVLMAEQNAEILQEDVGDMVEMVERCKRKYGTFPVVETVDGIWRDV